MAQLQQATLIAVKPSGEEVAVAEVVQAPPAEAMVAETLVAENTLPHTASSLPLIALMGLMALCGAFVVGAFARRLQ